MAVDSAQFRQVQVENYRCFHEWQTARLAPLTFLIGENSAGKTSFLALLRALWDIAYSHQAPDFRESPYDLGGFRDIAHERGRRGGRADSFSARFQTHKRGVGTDDVTDFEVRFEDRKSFPFPAWRRIASGDLWFEASVSNGRPLELQFGNARGQWRAESNNLGDILSKEQGRLWLTAQLLLMAVASPGDAVEPTENVDTPFATADFDELQQFLMQVELGQAVRPYASAPVRTYPQRTYQPGRPSRDPEGKDVPTLLAELHHGDPQQWESLKGQLETFGRTSGLFDEISVKPLTRAAGGPFQLLVRRFGGRLKGPHRNLIDVGYGVSQALPIFAELLRPDEHPLFLLQQPEVHLHPTAQAALGGLLCATAARGDQVVVETHSDYLVDRVRMDIRDQKTALGPDDVSILYFEREGLDVRIHSLGYDKRGNVLNTPPSYREFFMEETRRSIGL